MSLFKKELQPPLILNLNHYVCYLFVFCFLFKFFVSFFIVLLKKNIFFFFRPMSEASIIYNDTSISNPAVSTALVHPLVIFKIADYYLRRGKEKIVEKDKSGKDIVTEREITYCVGLLLGEMLNNEAIIRDVVALPPKAEKQEELVSNSYTQHHILFPNEKILGWYAFSEHYVEFPSIIAEGSNGIHLWMKPYVPPKIEAFSISKSKDQKLVSLPIQLKIDANIPEQLTLSRVADSQSNGSLQAAITELRNLLEDILTRVQKGNCSKEIKRKIYVALAQTELTQSSISTLEDSLTNIQNFANVLADTHELIRKVEDALSVQYQ